MRDLLVVVLELTALDVRAVLADVDSPGLVHREAARTRTTDLAADCAGALGDLEADDLGERLLALAVAVGGAPGAAGDVETDRLLEVLGAELPEGWGLPAALPVVPGAAAAWRRAGAPVPAEPLVAGAVVAAARAVGAHAHLPPADPAGPAGPAD